MKDFQVRYGLVCNEQRRHPDDVLVYRWPYGWAMVVNASNREKIVGVLNDNRTNRQLNIKIRPDDRNARRPGPESGQTVRWAF